MRSRLLSRVAPRAGGRIETASTLRMRARNWSPLARGRGSKHAEPDARCEGDRRPSRRGADRNIANQTGGPNTGGRPSRRGADRNIVRVADVTRVAPSWNASHLWQWN